MTTENKTIDKRKAECTRRTELAMLGLLIEKYPREAEEKTKKIAKPQRRKFGKV